MPCLCFSLTMLKEWLQLLKTVSREKVSKGIHSDPVYLSLNWWEWERSGGEGAGKKRKEGRGDKTERSATDKEVGNMQQTEGVKLLLTCTKAWTAWTCPAILKLSSPSPLQKEESKEHDVSMLTRQCRFRALYSTKFISRPRPYKN